MTNEQMTSGSEKPKTGIADFARETHREIAKVTWPTRKEITMTTILIVIFALVTGIFFLVIDSGLGFVISKLLGMN
ncbi:MAG: preprotein translocase subunit SecE [Bdellovibrionales bacterium]